MKQIKRVFLSLMLLAVCTLTSFATNPESQITQEMASEISEILNDVDSDFIQDEETKVKLTFVVNEKNEMVVISTSSKNYDRFLKAKLNYHRISSDNAEQNHIYEVDVVFRK